MTDQINVTALKNQGKLSAKQLEAIDPYTRKPDVSIGTLQAQADAGVVPALNDLTFSQREKDYINQLGSLWYDNFTKPNTEARVDLFRGVQPSAQQQWQDAIEKQVKAIGAPRNDTDVPDEVYQTIAYARIEGDQKKFAKERNMLQAINLAFGTNSLEGKDLEQMYLYNIYKRKLEDKILPLSILSHPAVTALNENDLTTLKNIVITSDPRWKDYQDIGWFGRVTESNRVQRELVNEVKEGKLTAEEYLQQLAAFDFLEKDRGWFRELATGFSKAFQQLSWSVTDDELVGSTRGVESYSSFAAPSYANQPMPSYQSIDPKPLIDRLYRAQTLTTEGEDTATTAQLSLASGKSFSDIWAQREEVRRTKTAWGLAINYGSLAFGGPIAKLGIGLTTKALTVASAGKAVPFMNSILGKGVVNVVGSNAPFIAAYQGLGGVNQVIDTQASNELLQKNESLMKAFMQGASSNFAANAGAALFFGMPHLAIAAGKQAWAWNVRSAFEKEAAIEAQAQQLSLTNTDPHDAAAMVNAAVEHGQSLSPNGSSTLYFDALTLRDKMDAAGIDIDALTPDQRNFFNDLNSLAESHGTVEISIGDYAVFFKEEGQLRDILESTKSLEEGGLPQELIEDVLKQTDKVTAQAVETMSELTTAAPDERARMARMANTTMRDELIGQVHTAINKEHAEGISAKESTQLATDVVNFFSGLMDQMGIEADARVKFFEAHKPKFRYESGSLNVEKGGAAVKPHGYDYNTNEIVLGRDSNILTTTQDLLHYYLETIMRLADEGNDSWAATLARDDVLLPYIEAGKLKGTEKWSDLTPELRRQIHEEFVYGEMIHRLNAASPDTYRPNGAIGPFNRAINNALLRYHLGETVVTPGAIAKTTSALGSELKAEGYSSARYSESELFDLFESWSNRDHVANRALDDLPVFGSFAEAANFDKLKSLLSKDELAYYQGIAHSISDYISDSVNNGALLHADKYLRDAKALNEQARELVANDPRVTTAKEAAEFQREVVAEEQKAYDKAVRESSYNKRLNEIERDAAEAEQNLNSLKADLEEARLDLETLPDHITEKRRIAVSQKLLDLAHKVDLAQSEYEIRQESLVKNKGELDSFKATTAAANEQAYVAKPRADFETAKTDYNTKLTALNEATAAHASIGGALEYIRQHDVTVYINDFIDALKQSRENAVVNAASQVNNLFPNVSLENKALQRLIDRLNKAEADLAALKGDEQATIKYKKHLRYMVRDSVNQLRNAYRDTGRSLREASTELKHSQENLTKATLAFDKAVFKAKAENDKAVSAKRKEIVQREIDAYKAEAKAKEQELRAKLDDEKAKLKTLETRANKLERDINERLAVFGERADAAAKGYETIRQEVELDLYNPKTKIGKRYAKTQEDVEALKNYPFPLTDAEGYGLGPDVIERLQDMGLIDAEIKTLSPEGFEVWMSRGNIEETLVKLSKHNKEKFIEREAAARFATKYVDAELLQNIQTSQLTTFKKLVNTERNIIEKALRAHVYTVPEVTVKTWVASEARAAVGRLKFTKASPNVLLKKANQERLRAFKCMSDFSPESLKQAYVHLINAENLTEMAKAIYELRPWMEKTIGKLRKLFKSKTFNETHERDTAMAALALLNKVGIVKTRGLRVNIEDIKRYNPAAAALIDSVLNAPDGLYFYKDMSIGNVLKVIASADNLIAKSKSQKERALAIDEEARAQSQKAMLAAVEENNAADPKAQQRQQERADFEGSLNEGVRNFRGEFERVAQDVKLNGTKVSFFCQRLDSFLYEKFGIGSRTEGPFYKYVYAPMRDAQTAYNNDSVRLARKLRPVLDLYRGLDKESFTKKGQVEIIADDQVALAAKGRDSNRVYFQGDVQHKLVGVMVHLGSAENFSALCRSFAVKEESMLRWIKDLEDKGFITKDMWDICQGIWNAYADIAPLSQRAVYEIEGRRYATVAARPINSRFGTYDGGYVPIKVLNREPKSEQISDLVAQLNESMPNGSFASERTVHYYDIATTVEDSLRGIDEQMRYARFLPVANKVLDTLKQSEILRNSLEDAVPYAIDNLFKPWLINTAKQNAGSISAPLKAVQRVAGALNASILALNVANAAQQLTGITVAAVRVKPSTLLWSFFTTNPLGGKDVQFIRDVSPFMASRFDANQKTMRTVAQEVHTKTTLGHARNWLNAHAYVLQSCVQKYVDTVIWKAQYHQHYDQLLKEGKLSTEEIKRISINEADDVVRSTQGSFDMVDTSLTENSAWTKVLTPFTNYFVTMGNLNATEAGIRTVAQRSAWRKMCSHAYVFAVATMIPTVLSTAMALALRGKLNDNDKEASDFLMEVGPVSILKTYLMQKQPMLGAIGSSCFDIIYGGKFSSNAVLSPPISQFLPSVSRAFNKLIKGEEMDSRDVSSMSRILGIVAIPLPSMIKEGNYLVNLLTGKYSDTGAIDAVRGAISSTPSANQLK